MIKVNRRSTMEYWRRWPNARRNQGDTKRLCGSMKRSPLQMGDSYDLKPLYMIEHSAELPSHKYKLFLTYPISFLPPYNSLRTMSNPSSKISYKTYCFEHEGNIMFFSYNQSHPIMLKNYKFQLGKVRIFTAEGRVLACQLTSNPHLNLSLDWNEEYFAKLFHGLARFQLEGSGDEYDDSMSLLVRDHFEQTEEIFLLRAKLTEEYGFDLTNEFWQVFKGYNQERTRTLQSMREENMELSKKADEELMRLVGLQERKEAQKDRLKGQLSALLREKENKLKEFGDSFKYFAAEKQAEPSIDLLQQKDSLSIVGSLFQDSQEFVFPSS